MPLPAQFFTPSFRRRRNGLLFSVLVGVMVYLATFVMVAEIVLFSASMTWNRDMNTRLTVEIPALGDESSTPQAERVKQALAIVRAMPGVERATLVPDDETARLLKPWIATPELFKSLPVPGLIDID